MKKLIWGHTGVSLRCAKWQTDRKERRVTHVWRKTRISEWWPPPHECDRKKERTEGRGTKPHEWVKNKKERIQKKKCQVQTEHFGLSLSFSLLVKAETNLDKENMRVGRRLRQHMLAFSGCGPMVHVFLWIRQRVWLVSMSCPIF